MQALQGARQTVFVTGEAGIGKTTVVEAFMAQVAAAGTGWVGHGQCIEQYGAGEAYLPLLEAMGRLGRSPDRAGWLDLLRRYAPSWLLQLPALVSADESADLQRRVGSTSRERMLLELAEAVEGVTVESLLFLVLGELRCSDVSTVDWLAYQARRREGARLLVVGTYRPVEAIVRTHPVRAVMQELLLHGQCEELALGYLPPTGIMRYLTQRFGEGVLPADLARILQQRTAGNPLLLVTVVEELVRQGMIRQGAMGWELVGGIYTAVGRMPDCLRQLLDRQVEQLPAADQESLEAASVVCRRGTDGRPDGTVTARYGFLHDRYRETLYSRVRVSRRGRWHRAMGRQLEVGYGGQA